MNQAIDFGDEAMSEILKLNTLLALYASQRV